ncbi:MAG TPA: heme-binding protein [Isosphaeraceae bacterium]|jgi:uncharacterized protein GlcG (DUF336 family)|nr:heme-binding protein [Isosphaeraceae bacterium]
MRFPGFQKGRRARPDAPRRDEAAPVGVEALETRTLMAGAVTASQQTLAALGAAPVQRTVAPAHFSAPGYNFKAHPNIGPPSNAGQPATLTYTLTPEEVQALLDRAAAATAANNAIVAVVDRGGNILGVRVEGGVSPQITGNTANLVFAIDGAVSLARTGAFFANNTAPLTSRTVNNLSQTTMTQREVQSNPDIMDPNSTLRGPGFVAPIGLKGHFPPRVNFTPQVDLFNIEASNRDSIVTPGTNHVRGTAGAVRLPSRFNVPLQYIPPNVQADPINPPESYGFVSGLLPNAQARGIATLPGGIPLYKSATPGGPESLVGGIGVFFPGTTGFATEENSKLNDFGYNPKKPDLSLLAEFIAVAAAGGSRGFNAPLSGPLGNAPALPNFNIPAGRIDLVGVSLDIVGPHGLNGPSNLLNYARQFGIGKGNALSGVNMPLTPGAAPTVPTLPVTTTPNFQNTAAGLPVQEGWLVAPHASADGTITAQDVIQMVSQGVTQANHTRAAIRLPLDNTTRMTFAVSDTQGNLLGLYRMPDSTFFSIDVAVAKSRNVAYYANPAQLQPIDQLPGIPKGTAFSARSFRYLAEPRFPEGIDGYPPGPFSILNDGGVNLSNGANQGPPLPASAFQSVQGFDVFNAQTNFHDPFNPANQDGIIFFPGGVPLYKTINGKSTLVGGLGVSGDGVDQDDVITAAAAAGFTPPAPIRVDFYKFRGVRIPYQKFNRQPNEPIGPQNVQPEQPIADPLAISPGELNSALKGKK